METWNVRQPYIDGFLPVVCTTDAYRPAGGVVVHIKLWHNQSVLNLGLPIAKDFMNEEHGAIDLANGTIIMTVSLALNLVHSSVANYLSQALHWYCNNGKYKTTPFILVGDLKGAI